MQDSETNPLWTALGRNLTYGLLDAVGRAIVTGHYDQKPFPTEAELAKAHGVSRSVTREAVKMLTAKGLLTARPRHGTTIQPPSTWNLFDSDVLRWLLERKFSLLLLRHFSELRIGVEPQAAALAAQYRDAAELAQIQTGYARMEAAEAGQEDPLDADISFHLAVLRASKNPFFLQLQDLVETALRTSIRFTNRFKGHSADLAAHKVVKLAIERQDAAAASAGMHSIIREVMELIHAAENGEQSVAASR